MARKILADQDFVSSSRIRNLPPPVNPDEPVRLSDLNSAVEGLSWKDSVRVASQVNVNIASPGASVDAVSLVSGDRVLVKAQTTSSENGLYVWSSAVTPMVRTLDTNTSAELEQAVTTVEEGTNAGTTWRQTSVNFVLDTDAVAFALFGSSVGAASETSQGIAELATQAETDAGTDDNRIITPLKLANWGSKAKRYQSTIGDGSATQIDATHNFNTRDLHVQVWETTGSYAQVDCEVSAPTLNTVRFNFSAAPAVNSLRVVIIA